MIVAGIGCRRGASAAQIGAAIAAALSRAGIAAVDLLAAPAAKREEPGIPAAAAALGVPLVLVPPADLEAAASRTLTRSERVIAVSGVPSIAEASALAAGGPEARLVAPRIAVGGATCALADSGSLP